MGMRLMKNKWLQMGRVVFVCVLAMTLAAIAMAQAVSTTTVQGTVYLANGQPGAGTLLISWPSFTTAAGQAVAADSITVAIGTDGFVSVNLAPNLAATPAGEFYTAVYDMSDGTTSTQYWVVPAAANASLASVQAQVMPAAQAVQTVSKAYVDQAIAELSASSGLSASGGTLTGPLYLSGDPTQPLQASDKHYVDTQVATAVPLAGGNMTGALTTPTVNGVQAPAVASAQTTLQAAMTAAGTNGAMVIPPTYAGTDTFSNANGVKVTDLRTSVAQQAERSVKEFGAVCDGATDDTNALQAALNYANAHGVALTIPQGTCKTRALSWHGESIGGLGKQVSALMGFPGQDVLESGPDATNMLSYTRLHDLTIYVDQSEDVSCSPAEGRAAAGSCVENRPIEVNSTFSPGGSGLTGAAGTGAAWSVGNCAIAMQAATGAGGNGLRVAEMENVEIATTGTDPLAAQYPGAHSTHTCGLYLAQWPQWSEFRNIDIRGLNTGVAIPALPVTAPAGLSADSNRWQNVTIQATHAFTAAAGSNNVLDNVVALAGNSSATGEPPTGLVLDLNGTAQGWTVRNAIVAPAWNAVAPALTVTAAGGAVTAVTLGSEHGLGWDPYGVSVPIAFSGSCTAQASAAVNTSGAITGVTVTAGGVGCSTTTTASLNAAGTWDTAAPVNLIGGQNMTLFAGNLLKGNGGYTVWNAGSSASYGTQLDSGGGTLPGGGTYAALAGSGKVGSAFQVDQFPGADIGAKIQACVNAVNATYGGTCDARNFTGNLTMGSTLTISTSNTAILLPCATITTANQIVVTAGTRNAALRGCALRGGSQASGSTGGTALAYTGSGAMVEVGDPTYAVDTPGFHMDNVVINTTAIASATAQGLVAYRTQELDLESLYFLGNSNQTGMTLDGTGNYTGGTFFDDQFSGFGTAINAIGHQVTNPATTDWMNASTFVRLHIDCPTSGGSPISGTYGINLQQGDGNTFTGGDVESCSTALHLGANAQNNTIVGLRNENSTSQVVADAGSSYNNWMTGGTMFSGKLTDNGTRNSFLDTFHRSFNALNGDWYESQQDATVTNHWRLGTGAGNERGLLNEIQTDYGYRWLEGFSDATGGEQLYQLDDLLNNVYRITVGQYLSSTADVVTDVTLNSGGCYSSNVAPTLAFSGGGGTGAAGTANMTTSKCSGGYTVGSVTMTSDGSGYTSQPTISWSGGTPVSTPTAIAEIVTTGSTNNQTALNAAGTGNVCFNCSTNSGTGGVTFASGGTTPTAVATVDKLGDGRFVGNLMVGGTTQSTGTMSLRNSADAEVDYYLWPGLTTSQKGSFTYKDWNGNSQWYLVKDASNNWELNSATGGLDSFKAYQSTNTGDTYIDASNSTGHVRFNYETGSGAETDIYSGSSTNLDAAFLAPNAIKFPGLAASSGDFCLQVDDSGYMTNTGSPCGTGSGGGGASGTINSGTSGQIAYYTTSGTVIGGTSAVPLASGGTGATTAAGAVANVVNGENIAPSVSASKLSPELDVTNPAYGAVGDCTGSGSTASCTDNCTPLTNAFSAARAANVSVFFPINSLSSGSTVYYTSCTINPQGVSFHGPTGSAGQSQVFVTGMLVSVRGAPGKDVFEVPDPGASAPALLSKGFSVRDIGINVDATVDASSSGSGSFPNRLPGRTCFDAVANGTAVITSAVQCQFQPGDVGQTILVNSVSTTVASWQSVNQVTLSATVTSGSSLTAYISVDGLSATQTIGNCGFAMDASGLAGGYGNGPLRADFTNVVIQLNGARTNNTCGYFFQGNAGPYQTKWDHDFAGGEFGFVFAMPNTAAGQAGGYTCQGMCDFNEFDNTWITATYPWISYGGNADTIKAMQISDAIYGPQILTGNGLSGNSETDTPDEWSIDIPEMEGEGTCPSSSTPPTTFRISGKIHTVERMATIYCSSGTQPTFQWDAAHSSISQLELANGGIFAVTGNHNTFNNPFYPNAPPPTYNITGDGNLLKTCTTSGQAFGQEPGRCQYAGLINTGVPGSTFGPPKLARGSVALNRTHDFIEKGAAAYYFNDEDLWYWPDELMDANQITTVVNDSSSETGEALSIAGTSSYSLFGADGTEWFYGSQVPASKVRFYVMAKANAPISWNVNLASYSSGSGYSTLCAISPTLTTSYAVYECDADATTYSGTSAYMSLGAAGAGNTISVAWIGIKPWFSDLEINGPVNATNFQVSGSPVASGNLADWTDSGVANGNVPVWNSTTSKWTPGAQSGGTVSDGSGTTTPTEFAESTSAGHTIQYRTPAQALSDLGAAAAQGNATVETSSWSFVATGLYRANCSTGCTGTLASTLSTGFMAAVNNGGSATVTIASGGPTLVCSPVAACTIPPGGNGLVYTDGTDWYLIDGGNATEIDGGAVPASAAVIATNSSGQPVSAATTGSGNVVLATSPSLSGPTMSGTLAGASETLSGTLSVTGAQTLAGATTMQSNATLENGVNSNQTLAIQPGSSAEQVGAVQFNSYTGTSEWQVRKDASNNLRVTDAVNSLDRVILPANANTTINAGAGANAVAINNTSGSGTSGFIVYEGGTNNSTAAFQVSGSGNTTATGYLQGKFIMGSGSMGVATGAAAGSSPSIACATSHVCDGVSGTVTLTTGTSPTTGTLATLNFPNTHTNQANCMVSTLSATGIITSNTWTESTTAVTITANTALTASTAYTIKYWCGSY
jgi:hypothetical protein